MATSYKTPGVYIEEISAFPPSVAQVETAIPVFIGYTEKANKQGESLLNVPTPISSLLEFTTYFGGAPAIAIDKVTTDENNSYAVTDIAFAADSRFYLHDSIRLFYDNGGGKCYIIAVNLYADGANPNPVQLGDPGTPGDKGLLIGLGIAAKIDDPTIIVFPDAVLMGNADLYSLQQAALMQCADLQSRVSVFDLPSTGTDPVSDFRNNIGINNLSYGMAYTPWLNTVYSRTVNYSDFKDHVVDSVPSPVNLATLTTDSTLNALVASVETALADQKSIEDTIEAYPDAVAGLTMDGKFKALADAVAGSADLDTDLGNLMKWMVEAANNLRTKWSADDTFKNPQLKNSVTANALSPTLWNGGVKQLGGILKNPLVVAISDQTASLTNENLWGVQEDAILTNGFDYSVSGSLSGAGQAALIVRDLTAAYNKIGAFIQSVRDSAAGVITTAQNALYEKHPIIANIAAKIQRELQKIPPSGAMAGIYARVDGQRGVWKAPANESVNSVTGPVAAIGNDEQAELNVDPVAGKSINAIRVFRGKGTLVWGARTLAGNDNDWRYINVRRFCIMVEQSSKNAAGAFVFEPNDANTWAKVQGMLENFLVKQWRAGALQGAKASDAFYVAVGLGKTMNSQDVLEGRMNVEIGMAVVRPAEFIILRFTQLMAKS